MVSEPSQTILNPAPAEESISVLPVQILPENPEQFEADMGGMRLEIIPISSENPEATHTPTEFTLGMFTMGFIVKVDIDGAKYFREAAIFSPSELNEFEFGSGEFISSVARRAFVFNDHRRPGRRFPGSAMGRNHWVGGAFC